MLGWTELGLLVAVGGYVVGLRGLPMLARHVGFGIGTSIKYLRAGTTALGAAAREHNVTQLQQDMQAGLAEVRQIQAEWQSLTQLRSLTGIINPSSPLCPPPTSVMAMYQTLGRHHHQMRRRQSRSWQHQRLLGRPHPRRAQGQPWYRHQLLLNQLLLNQPMGRGTWQVQIG
ncbi:uncharacterized protein MONBRDRAFT_8710 [Monosiga brevicollis MX1]|uniref:Uncharacterized protein n=1 Tax=Monosiga brevicollis TaxID=81824 RepID=A9V0W5_MONBE|nr:uncharacterized protein MONBRDRAFT_8710 [Monosiga brevicollis MX1]EDQ88704.1 predicted protein [Monosiga brevicollis MX1]|eukprot:XP_001746317.1 hypothetical protein [Monosiga brevicollis MX1]